MLNDVQLALQYMISHVSVTVLIVFADPNSLWKPYQWEHVQQIYNLSAAAPHTTGIFKYNKAKCFTSIFIILNILFIF